MNYNLTAILDAWTTYESTVDKPAIFEFPPKPISSLSRYRRAIAVGRPTTKRNADNLHLSIEAETSVDVFELSIVETTLNSTYD